MPSVDGAPTMPTREAVEMRGSGRCPVFSADTNWIWSRRAPPGREGRENGSRAMTLPGRLNMVVAYVVFAFVGAIVLGLF